MKEVERGDRLLDGWDVVVWVWDMVLAEEMVFGLGGDLTERYNCESGKEGRFGVELLTVLLCSNV